MFVLLDGTQFRRELMLKRDEANLRYAITVHRDVDSEEIVFRLKSRCGTQFQDREKNKADRHNTVCPKRQMTHFVS